MATINDTLAALATAVKAEHVKQKTLKGNRIDYIEWHTAARLLNEICPAWRGEVRQVVEAAAKIAVVYRITLPCEDGEAFREAIGNEDDEASGYGDPFSNAEAMAFKRAAAKFGLGLDLYLKDKPLAAPERPQRPAQRQPGAQPGAPAQRETVPVRQLPELHPAWAASGGEDGEAPDPNTATEKQVNAIFGIGKKKGLDAGAVNQRAMDTFGVRIPDLTKNQASQLIQSLQEQEA